MPISISPPIISAARNCQPRKIRIKTQSSITRLVDANIKATAATKWMPLSTKARAAASAAKEQDEDAAPKSVAIDILLRFALPM